MRKFRFKTRKECLIEKKLLLSQLNSRSFGADRKIASIVSSIVVVQPKANHKTEQGVGYRWILWLKEQSAAVKLVELIELVEQTMGYVDSRGACTLLSIRSRSHELGVCEKLWGLRGCARLI